MDLQSFQELNIYDRQENVEDPTEDFIEMLR